MTREHAAEQITAALAAHNLAEDADAFAQRLATALDALQLLEYAENPTKIAAAPTPDPNPAQSHETPPWAATRQRT